MNKLQVQSLILALLMTGTTLASCGSSSTPSDTTAPSDDTTAADTGYQFPKYDGYEFKVLNIDDIFSMRGVIDPGETNGDYLNDAQYECVRKLEEETGVTFVETNIELQNDFVPYFQNFILAGDDAFDIAYMNQRDYYTFASEGYLTNLLDTDGFNFGEEWWLNDFNGAITFNDELLMARGYAQLMMCDAITIMIFNKSMMDTLNLEAPYQLVKDGKWTFDALETYLKAAANLNGDEAFKWTESGQCVWGMVLPNNTAGFFPGTGERYVEFVNGELVITCENERFYNVAEKNAALISQTADGLFCHAHFSGDDKPDSYVGIFENQRAMFGQSEIAKTGRLRSADFTFGVLPHPKFDENQDRYYSSSSYPASGVTIPVTVQNPTRSAELADALNYLAKEMVWPVYREVTLDQKNLRDEESIEMLDIILEASLPNYTSIFSLTGGSLFTEIAAKMRTGDGAIASTVAANISTLKEEVAKVNGKD